MVNGIDNPGRPFNPATYAAAMDPRLDPYVAEERAAIQSESDPSAFLVTAQGPAR